MLISSSFCKYSGAFAEYNAMESVLMQLQSCHWVSLSFIDGYALSFCSTSNAQTFTNMTTLVSLSTYAPTSISSVVQGSVSTDAPQSLSTAAQTSLNTQTAQTTLSHTAQASLSPTAQTSLSPNAQASLSPTSQTSPSEAAHVSRSKTAKFNEMVSTLRDIIAQNSKVYAFQDIPPSNRKYYIYGLVFTLWHKLLLCLLTCM